MNTKNIEHEPYNMGSKKTKIGQNKGTYMLEIMQGPIILYPFTSIITKTSWFFSKWVSVQNRNPRIKTYKKKHVIDANKH
jgi:hypothetical protein